MAGQSITLEMLQKKPAMIEALRVREAHEAPLKDNGEVPGDHLGAAGFDSAFFAHLKVKNKTWFKIWLQSGLIVNALFIFASEIGRIPSRRL